MNPKADQIKKELMGDVAKQAKDGSIVALRDAYLDPKASPKAQSGKK